MADEVVYHHAPKTEEHSGVPVKTEPAEVESTDRGLFGFGKKDEEKKCDEAAISSEFEGKVHVSEPETKTEEKKESLLEKLHRSDSSSSSSSDEEESKDGEKKKKKKGLKEKKEEEKIKHDTNVPIEKCDEVVAPPPSTHPIDSTHETEEKKGLMEKIKEKLPGGHKKVEGEHVAPPPPTHEAEGEHKEKKGIFEKIKEKIPGYSSKSEEEKKEDEKKKECD